MMACILGILLSCIAGAARILAIIFPCLIHLLSHKWYVDLTVNHGIVLPFLNLCDRLTFQVIDKQPIMKGKHENHDSDC